MEIFFKPFDRRRWRLAAPLFAALALAACNIPVDQRGNLPDASNLTQIKPGETDKATVTRLIGSPSSVASFDPNVWYYISQKTRTIAFFRTEASGGHSNRASARTAKPAPRVAAAARPAAKKVAKAAPSTQGVRAQQARAKGFALDLNMGGPDAEDADFRESA